MIKNLDLTQILIQRKIVLFFAKLGSFRRYSRIFMPILFVSLLSAIQNNELLGQNNLYTPIGSASLSSKGTEYKSDEDVDFQKMTWKEDAAKRTEYSAHYYTTDGFVKNIYSQTPIHFFKNNSWEPILPTMESNGADGWHAPNQPFPVSIKPNGAFELSTLDNQFWNFGNSTYCQNQNVQYILGAVDENTFFFESVNHSVAHTKEIFAIENGIKYNYRINENPNLGSVDLVFSEKINVNKNYMVVQIDERKETFWGTHIVSQIIITDENKKIVGQINPAYAVDAAHASYPLTYKLSHVAGGEYQLDITLSNDWFSNPDRQFPIIIDPLVIGPMAQWNGGTMPSCIAPQQNIDSILVTIPAGVSIISLAVTSSFYADPFTSATMSMGAMQFSTSCASTQLFQVTGSTGSLPGTAYLDSANLFNPLTCCYQKSCSQQQFYLRKHLSRSGPGVGCNTTFIRYDPVTTQWPFRAIVYGRTPETHSSEWTVPQTIRCADNCDFNAQAFVRYGVPPFTFTHPWQDTVFVQGTPAGCITGQVQRLFQLTIPNCPIYCDEDYTSLPVPNPTVVDACGFVITGFPNRTLNISPSPLIIPLSDTIFCAGDTIDLSVENCLTSPDISWSAGELSGTTNIYIETDPNLQGTQVYNVLIQSTVNNCEAPDYLQAIYVQPLPNVSFEVTSENTFLGDLIDFQNTSTGVSLNDNNWIWQFGDGNDATGVNAQYSYNSIGNFEVCLGLAEGAECASQFCQLIPVVPNAVDVPNVFSPNNDGINDFLYFFFDWAEIVELEITNRWGNVLANVSITDANGGWDGKDQNTGENAPDGVYFYSYRIVTILGGVLEGHSFVHLIRG
jgi:gliding motility-associated-like protein